MHLHPTDAQVARLVAPTGVAWVVLVAVAVQLGSRTLTTVALVVVSAASLVGLWVGLRRRGLVLTPDAAVLVGRRTRRVPWSEVTGVVTERRGLSHLVVLQTERHRHRCPAPLGGPLAPDRHFDEKAVYVQRWWAACRGPDPEGGPRPTGGDTGWGHPVLPGEVPGPPGPPPPAVP